MIFKKLLSKNKANTCKVFLEKIRKLLAENNLSDTDIMNITFNLVVGVCLELKIHKKDALSIIELMLEEESFADFSRKTSPKK